MARLIDVKWKGSKSISCWANIVTIFDFMHDLNNGFLKVKYWNSRISVTGGPIDRE